MTAAQPAASGATDEERRQAATAERKALLNLAGLALEQARQSLNRLSSLPLPAETAQAQAGLLRDTARSTTHPGTRGETSGDGMLQRQLESLGQQLAREQQTRMEALAVDNAANLQSPIVVDRYTASGRRNAVRTARGSLHINPPDERPAPAVARHRSPPPAERLPSVEYLLGDPLRSANLPRAAAEADKPRPERRAGAAGGTADGSAKRR